MAILSVWALEYLPTAIPTVCMPQCSSNSRLDLIASAHRRLSHWFTCHKTCQRLSPRFARCKSRRIASRIAHRFYSSTAILSVCTPQYLATAITTVCTPQCSSNSALDLNASARRQLSRRFARRNTCRQLVPTVCTSQSSSNSASDSLSLPLVDSYPVGLRAAILADGDHNGLHTAILVNGDHNGLPTAILVEGYPNGLSAAILVDGYPNGFCAAIFVYSYHNGSPQQRLLNSASNGSILRLPNSYRVGLRAATLIE